MTSNNMIPDDVRKKYLERRNKDLEICRQALSIMDFSSIATIGHQIKGNAISFGFEELAPIAIELEKNAISKDTENLKKLLIQFDNCLKNLNIKQ